MPDAQDQSEQIIAIAKELALETAAAIKQAPSSQKAHHEQLEDLKLITVRKALALTDFNPPDELVWSFANNLPDYDLSGLYQTRTSFLALTCSVVIGWLIGGLVSAFLGFFALGGEILRPAAILACLWLEEYLGTNPKARKTMLAVLGMGSLARFASALAAGAIRLASFKSIGQLIFGGARPNFFKAAWLWFGAAILFVFFAKKTTGVNIDAFEEKLAGSIRSRLDFLRLVFVNLKNRTEEIENLKHKQDLGSACPNTDCPLAAAAIELMPGLDANRAKWLADILNQLGFATENDADDFLVWQNGDEERYDPMGLIQPGDRCRILKRPYRKDDMIVKGQCLRVGEEDI